MRLTSKVVLLLTFGVSSAWAGSKEHLISIRNMQFEPAAVNVNIGDMVIWKNEDLVPHSATAKGVFDSGILESDKSYKFVVKKKGSFEYICSFHPTMKAMIKVR
ncbi:MAG: hypothetical protein A4S09_00945 [Proteobacteria bacterium SG_bin7]|nr:MAG: hypothetical protein A4S09_00945 [Proteobacteria bacterium SG_bin7]